MSVLVLSDADVRALLTMAECIEAMEATLAGLARGELYQPLRPGFFPPGADGLIGLMPAYRSAEPAYYSLKEIVVTPGNPAARGIDAHQGGVLLHDGVTGELVALLNASPITEIRTAAVSAVATRALARKDAAVVAVLGTGVQSRSHG
jgi:ornithine cyclodeaminase